MVGKVLSEEAERERREAFYDMASRSAARADAARAAVATELRALLKMTVAEAGLRSNLATAESKIAYRTVTMSISEAVALADIAGPQSQLKSYGAVGVLFAAMEIARRQLLLRGDEVAHSRRAALLVLKLALDDCMAGAEQKAEWLLPRRRWSRRKPPDAGDLLKPG